MIWDVSNKPHKELGDGTILITLAGGTNRECVHKLERAHKPEYLENYFIEQYGDGSVVTRWYWEASQLYAIDGRLYVSTGSSYTRGYKR